MLPLVGCSTPDYGDLDTFIGQVKARRTGRVAPLPDFNTYETYTYSAADLRDPFQPDEKEATIVSTSRGNGISPNLNRNKEALEHFPLDSLKFVGHMERSGKIWAFITAPDQMVHRVRVGNHVGQNHGKIQAVSETEIDITEIIPDGLGGWFERPAKLVLAE